MDWIKKYGGYIGVLAVGLFLGYLFSNGKKEDAKSAVQHSEHEVSYTCSMHPNVRQKEMGSCPLCGMDLTQSEPSGGAMAHNQFQLTEEALALANVETTTLGIGSLEGNKLVLSGKITSNEQTDAMQTSIFDGRIESLDINYVGQYIKKGKKIGMIYAPDMYLAQDKLLTAQTYKNTHEKLFASSRNTLGLWKLTDAQIDQVLKTGKPILNFPITADVSGTVTEVMAKEGNFYKQGDPLFKVSNLYTVWAVFDAYENQLPLLKAGQEITITSNAFKGTEYTAKIAFVDPVLDASKRTVSVRATLINKEGLLKPGMFVEGIAEVAIADAVLTVPKSAVLWTGKRSLVYVKPDPSKPVFEMVEVRLGNAVGDAYLVVDGLSSGDEVVVNGTFTVDAAAQLQGKKSMMSSKAGMQMLEGNEMVMNLGAEVKEKFELVLGEYDKVKQALVRSDNQKTAYNAAKLFEGLSGIQRLGLNAEGQDRVEKMREASKKISETDDLEKQRKEFKPLSEQMVAMVSQFADLDQPVYVQFCPMADNNQGASWLSFQEQVRNPYFGDAMLTCGSVTKTIQ